ncbi:MAG: 3-hydroxyisobutyrate dehydrogenase-like beta-hydroxyacid dehydrogenase [Hyphomicrobiaceae bacterium]|jgi:3-hydroxyisobutyrate dehydrogenase-like beta-hydroxyacid dehydrogenase
MTTKTVGFIGLGKMGGAMALNLLKSEPALHVFDAFPAAIAPLTEAGATASTSPADLASKCDVILMCLPFAPEVREAVFGANGIKSTARSGLTIIDTTTLDRTDAIAFGEELAQSGIGYWDCPVSGAPHRAQSGTLTVMFGGTKDAFDVAKPYLDTFGEDVVHTGPLGCGQAMKAINNIVYNVNIAAICEALPLAMAVGLDPEVTAQVLTTASGRSFASEYFVPRMMERKFDFDFTLSDAYKDIVNVQKMGIETRASLPVVNAMIATYQTAIASGYGDLPKSAMLKVYENALGVEFKKKDD